MEAGGYPVGECIVDGVTGLDYDTRTGILSLTSGYVIPTTMQEANWDTHLSSDGTDHTYVDQDLQTTASPTFADLTITGTGEFGEVGIGTTSPDRDLEIRGSRPVIRLRDTGASADATTAYIEFGGTDGGAWNRTGYLGDSASGDTHIRLRAEDSDLILGDSSSASVLTLSGGNVTITGTLGAGAITGTSFIIGGNTLDTNEWAFLDGLDQALKTISKPTFGSTVSTNFLMGTNVAVDDEGAANIMIGYEAGRNNDHVAGETGNQNVYIGYQSGKGATGVTKNTGSSNIGIGYRTLYKNTSGSYNFALGYVSLDANTSGTGHVSIGYAALSQLTTGHNNVAIGRSSLTALGGGSSSNTAIGTYTGLINTTGSRNIYIGYRTGRYQTGSDILLIQSQTNASSAADEIANSIIYGVMAAAPANQSLRINASLLATDKVAFTQTDLNEYIDSLADGYMDYGATLGHRINVGGAYKYTLPVADGSVDEVIKTNGSGTLSFVRMPKAIYAELSDSADQAFAVAGTHYSITFDTNDEIAGITHSTSVDPENITIVTTGVYTMFAQPQVAAAPGGAGTFHMWLQKDAGGGFVDIADTNIELSLTSGKEDVIPLATTFLLTAGDIIRLRVNVSDNGIKLDAQAAIVGPPTEPAIPSIIFTMFMMGT